MITESRRNLLCCRWFLNDSIRTWSGSKRQLSLSSSVVYSSSQKNRSSYRYAVLSKSKADMSGIFLKNDKHNRMRAIGPEWSHSALEYLTINKKRVRLQVLPGGCSGLKFQFADLSNDEQINEGDREFAIGSSTLVIDELTLPFMPSARVDYQDDLERSGLKLVSRSGNNALSGKCGCGTSFSPDNCPSNMF